MAILPPGTPGRLPAVPVPATILPPLPVAPVAPVGSRTLGDPQPPRPLRPGSIIDTWASPVTAGRAPTGSAYATNGTLALLLPAQIASFLGRQAASLAASSAAGAPSPGLTAASPDGAAAEPAPGESGQIPREAPAAPGQGKPSPATLLPAGAVSLPGVMPREAGAATSQPIATVAASTPGTAGTQELPLATGTMPASLSRPSPASVRPAPVLLTFPLPDPDQHPDPVPVLARALQAAVESSGLFYESHLAQWVDDRRSLDDVRREAVLIAASKVARAESGEPDPVRNQQVDYLRQGEAGWTLPPPWQDRATLWIGEEAPDTWHESADAARMTLDLDLPGRGRVQVTLRLREADLRADVVNGPGTHLEAAELAALAHRLSNVPGTRLAAMRIESALDGPREAAGHETWREAGNAD